MVCGNCIKDTRTATSYCRDCGEFICAACVDIHTQWGKLSKHEVVPLDEFEKKVKQLDALKKVTLYCSLHEGKELELYCETCEELICHNCIVKKHRDHQYDLVTDTFERQKGEIIASLEPVERHLENANKMLKQIEAQSKAAKSKRDVVAAEIQQKTRELQEMLEKRKDELVGQLDESTQQTLKDLATQKDEVEMTQTQLASCLSFVRESLRTGSQGEVMKMKKGVVKQIKEITGSIKSEKQLPPCDLLNVCFSISPETAHSCQQLVRQLHVRKLDRAMAAYLPDPIVEPNSQPQINIRWAMKAIARVGRVLHELLEPEQNCEKVDLFIQHGLLKQEDLKDVVKGLQQRIAEDPSLFGVLLHELSSFSSDEADVVVKKLQGTSCNNNNFDCTSHEVPTSYCA